MATRPGGRHTATSTTHTQPDQPEHLQGQVLDGRYLIGDLISSGGMGFIFKGTQLSTSRQVAIKVLKPSLTHSEGLLVDRFRQEFEVLGTLSHQNIVHLIDSGISSSQIHYMVMELVEGKTFRDTVMSQSLSLPELLDIFAQISRALFEAHTKAIVHRDLKLENVMIVSESTGDQLVKILDFGVAKMLSSGVNLTHGGQLPGTPGVIAPELIAGLKPTPSSDLYSLGIMMYIVLSGRVPFEHEDDIELLRAHQFEEIPRLDKLVHPETPQPLIDLTNELLSKKPELRPRDAHSVRLRLRQIERDYLVHHRDPKPYTPVTSHTEVDTPVIESSYLDEEETYNVTTQNRLDSFLGEPEERILIVPTSVVVALALLLLVLIVCIAYLLYPLFLAPQPPAP